MNEESDSSLNILLLKLTCQKILTQITKSASLCPWYIKFTSILQVKVKFKRQIRKIVIHIKEVVGKKFPGYEHVSMGSFLFLRYFVPAIAVPSQFGILKSTFFNETKTLFFLTQIKADQDLFCLAN